MISVFTSAAPNYVGKVRVLLESLREHCPEMRRHWLVSDRRDETLYSELANGDADELIFVDELPGHQDPAWLFQHDIVELSTAIKPAAAMELMDRPDCEYVIYFDPDQVVFSPLPDLIDALSTASLALTPHLLKPEEGRKAVEDNELCALRNGIFNLGFFGVRRCDEGWAFLEWWRDRCLEFCFSDWTSGAFTDQKWLNFAPVYFPQSVILRSPRFNVAPWNINQRKMSGSADETYEVDGEPLGFYHFTGFDKGDHRTVIDWYAAGNRSVHGLVDWYEERSRFLTPDVDLSWGLGRYENGAPILSAHRRIYRDRNDLRAAFPDPYAVGGDGGGLAGWFDTEGRREFPELSE